MPIRGQAGGRAVLAKYGKAHFKELGKKGFDSFVARYFAGRPEEAVSWLHRRAAERVADSHADRLLQERIDAGEKVVSQELPIYEEPGEVPF